MGCGTGVSPGVDGSDAGRLGPPGRPTQSRDERSGPVDTTAPHCGRVESGCGGSERVQIVAAHLQGARMGPASARGHGPGSRPCPATTKRHRRPGRPRRWRDRYPRSPVPADRAGPARPGSPPDRGGRWSRRPVATGGRRFRPAGSTRRCPLQPSWRERCPATAGHAHRRTEVRSRPARTPDEPRLPTAAGRSGDSTRRPPRGFQERRHWGRPSRTASGRFRTSPRCWWPGRPRCRPDPVPRQRSPDRSRCGCARRRRWRNLHHRGRRRWSPIHNRPGSWPRRCPLRCLRRQARPTRPLPSPDAQPRRPPEYWSRQQVTSAPPIDGRPQPARRADCLAA